MSKLNVKKEFESAVLKVVRLMETEGSNWTKGWKTLRHCNPISGSMYKGINPLLLAVTCANNGWESSKWATYKQLKTKGWRIKSSEVKTRTPIFFYSVFEKENKKTGELETIPFLKVFYVYNFSQLEKDEETLLGSSMEDDQLTDNISEDIISGLGIDLRTGNPAFYPSQDFITMPKLSDFTVADEYHSTLFHEIGHWTGHEARLNRLESVQSKNDPRYAFEELVAELTSCILCSQFGVDKKSTDENHAKYINGWISHIKNRPNALYQAASAASKAAEFVLTELAENSSLEETAA